MADSFPKDRALLPDQVMRVNKARLCMLLHKTPEEIDAAGAGGLRDIMDVVKYDERVAELQQRRKKR